MSKRVSNLLRGRGTLQGQALSRLLLVALLAALVITLVAFSNYYQQRRQEVTQKLDSTQKLYEKGLPQLENSWQVEAEQMKGRIEFSRILEERGAARWPRFNAFLNAQAEFAHFPNILIMNGADQILFRYGPEALRLQADQALLTSSWHYAGEAQELYRAYRLPVWLGAEGQGSLLLLKTVNNAAISALAVPETHLHLFFRDRIMASSNREMSGQIKPGVRGELTAAALPLIQTELTWPGSGDRPLLVVQRELHAAHPLAEFLLRPLTAILVITALIWLGLGRWLTRTIKRIEVLNSTTEDFGQTGRAADASKQLQGVSSQPDEVSKLAGSLDKFMHGVESRNFEQQLFLDTLAMLEEAVLELAGDGVIARASPGWIKLSRSENTIGKKLRDFIDLEDREVLHTHYQALVSGDKAHAQLRLRLRHGSGEEAHSSWVECRFVRSLNESGEFEGVRGVLRDITQAYMHEKQITHMALHDALTGLPNRVLLEDRFRISLRHAARAQQKVGVCFIDLDHFKNVNDTLGHKSGDKLLLVFAERLHRQLRDGDTVARWGGDEFVLLLPDMESEQDIREVALKVCKEMQAPLQLEDTELVMTYSMGVAFFPDDGEDIETLFSQADRAMFFAKAQGRNQTCFFRDMTSKGIGKKELYIQNRLATAINSQQIQAWFQPVIAADSGRCISVEVLARWQDKEQGWISPATFIPMAENLGLIQELGQQVLQASLGAAQRWQELGLNLTMAINVSKRQLFTPYFTERLKEQVAKHNIDPHRIILEITESVAMLDVEHAVERVQEIRQAGFQIALDDFGTGYSSLSQLHEMHVDELKIDISFVRRLYQPSGLSMTQAIINLARALNMATVAEGVESEEAANKLRNLGVDKLQGYYFARPMPIDEFEQWLLEHNP